MSVIWVLSDNAGFGFGFRFWVWVWVWVCASSMNFFLLSKIFLTFLAGVAGTRSAKYWVPVPVLYVFRNNLVKTADSEHVYTDWQWSSTIEAHKCT
jgi:hypothetical protein